jgi:hypothetical protein
MLCYGVAVAAVVSHGVPPSTIMSDTQPHNHDAPRPTPEAAPGMVVAGRWRLTQSLSSEPSIWEATDARLDDRRLLLVILPKVDVATATTAWGTLQSGTLLTLVDVHGWPPAGSVGVFSMPTDAMPRSQALLSRETLASLLCEHASTLQRAQSLPLAVRVCATAEPWVATLGAPRLLALPLPGSTVDEDRRADREQFIVWLAAALQGFQGGSANEALATFPDAVRRVVEPWLQEPSHSGYAIDPAALAMALQVQTALPRAPIPASRAPQRPVPASTPWGARRRKLNRRLWLQLAVLLSVAIAVPITLHTLLTQRLNHDRALSEQHHAEPAATEAPALTAVAASPLLNNSRQTLWTPWLHGHPADQSTLDPTQFTAFDSLVVMETSADRHRSMVHRFGELQRHLVAIETRVDTEAELIQRWYTTPDQVVQYHESIIADQLTLTPESGQVPPGLCRNQRFTTTHNDQYAWRSCADNAPGHVAFGCRALQFTYEDDARSLPSRLQCLNLASQPMRSFTGWSSVTFEWKDHRLVRVDFFDAQDQPIADRWYGGSTVKLRVRPDTGERVLDFLIADGLAQVEAEPIVRRVDTAQPGMLSVSVETAAHVSGLGFRQFRRQLQDAPVFVDEWFLPGNPSEASSSARPRQTWSFSPGGHLTGLTGQAADDAPVALEVLAGAHTVTFRYNGEYRIAGVERVYPDGTVRADSLTLDSAGRPTVVHTTWAPSASSADPGQVVLTRDLNGRITRRSLLAADGQLATMETPTQPDAAETAWVWDEDGDLLSITREPDSGTQLPPDAWARITYTLTDGIRRAVTWETTSGDRALVLHPAGVMAHGMTLEYDPDGRMVAQVLQPSGDRIDCHQRLCLDATGLGTVPIWDLWMPDVAAAWEFQ